jgi:outer membrane lipoprotein SlyB
MNRTSVLVGFLPAALAGCASTHDLYDEPKPVMVQVVRQAAEQNEAWILLQTWRTAAGRVVRADDNGLTVAEDPGGEFRRYSWEEIRTVTVGERSERESAGMTRGALYGGVIAGFVGWVASGRMEGAAIGPCVGALAGAVTGMTGAMSSSTAGEYQLVEPYDRFALRTVQVARIDQETDVALAVSWRGSTVWLPKAHTVVEPLAGGFRVTAPRRLLEATPPANR